MSGPPKEGRYCGACGAVAPKTDTDYTLIGAAHGWRLLRSVGTDGSLRMSWRCATCFAKRRAQTTE